MIKCAYKKTCRTYDDLLNSLTMVDEELLHISAPSRLDYFKQGCLFEARVHEKRKASLLATSGGNGAAASCDCGAKNEADAADDDDGANAEAKTAKRHRSAGD
ncbi:hypothetical protein M885DRAFT_549983 [Pelagophyceae sp. CCMP2097]|nr:hypothetical protein M885DRAFT_549983 [Pelagophyceae sp. CCMP2097]